MKKQQLRNSVLATVVLGILATAPAFAASKDHHHDDVRMPNVDLGGINANKSFGGFIVTYRSETAAKTSPSAIARSMNTGLSRAGLVTKNKATVATYVRKLAVGGHVVRTSRMLDRAEAEAFMRQIAADPNVASVALDVMRRATRDIRAPASLKKPLIFTPGDTYYEEDQSNFRAPDGTLTKVNKVANLGGANINSAWDLADGTGITIADLDTGITAHPDVNTSMADAGYDFITDMRVSGRAEDGRAPGGWDTGDWTNEEPWISLCTDELHPPEASSWHGTHTASTMGAELTDNAVGESGIAYNAKVVPVRVLGHCGGSDSDISDAIVWASGGHVDGVPDNTNPAQVINMSLGGKGACDDATAKAIAQANERGTVVVVSAGNDNKDTAAYSPANCPGVITVAATSISSKRAYYSNYGASVEIAAPGGGVYPSDTNEGPGADDLNPEGYVWQALNPGKKTPTPLADVSATGAYAGASGTSMAAPHVTGTVALMQSARLDAGMPLLTPAEVLTILQSTAHAPAAAPAANRAIGAGILDAGAAVAKAIEPPCTENCAPVAVSLTNMLAVSVSGGAGNETLYSIEVPAGTTGPLSILTSGGSGDVSLFVSFGEEPTAESAQYKSVRAGNSETVRVAAPQAGTYYIKLVGTRAYSGVRLQARYN